MARTLSTEVLALWFVFLDRRVSRFTKVLLLLPIVYVISPIDLLRDTLLGWGQVDDLAVLRIGHFLLTRFIDPDVVSDGRQRAAAFLDGGRTNRAAFCFALTAVWGLTILLALQWFVKRFFRHT